MGEIVIDCFEENFCELMNYDFIVQMENSFDQVVNYEVEWKVVLDYFFLDFIQQLDKVEKDSEEGGMCLNQMVLISIDCLICGCKMGICIVSIGVFFGCFGYVLLLKECCKIIINLVLENEVLNVLEGEDVEINVLCVKCCCLKCGMVMDSYFIDLKCKLYVCGNNLICDGYEIEEGEFCIKGYDGLIVECEKCGFEMYLKMGCFGKYMVCINEECKNICKILCNGEVVLLKEDLVLLFELLCEKLDVYFVLCDGVVGVFLVVNIFLKLCEMCVLLVEEFYCFCDCLLEKLCYLVDVLQQDSEGNKIMVCFSCKIKQ